MNATLKELVRRKANLINGTSRPGRVTQFAADEKGRVSRHPIDPETFRRQQARHRQLNVAAARAKLGLSQVEIALLLGISPRTFQNWEQGHRSPTGAARVLLRLAEKNPQAVLEVAS